MKEMFSGGWRLACAEKGTQFEVGALSVGIALLLNLAVMGCTSHDGGTGGGLDHIEPASILNASTWECAAGDWDRDGVLDGLKGNSAASLDGLMRAGCVYVTSGKTGKILWMVRGKTSDENLGVGVCLLTDFDGDGRGEVVVSSGPMHPENPSGLPSLVTSLYSSVNNRLPLWSVREVESEASGYYLVNVGDWNGDGVEDVGVRVSGELKEGVLRIRSGSSGGLIREFRGMRAGEAFGAVFMCEDINGDGLSDLIVGSGGWKGKRDCCVGRISGISGVTGEVLWQREGTEERPLWSQGGGIWDLDGDGIRDFQVLHMSENGWTSELCSGRTGEAIREIRVCPSGPFLVQPIPVDPGVDSDGRRWLPYSLVFSDESGPKTVWVEVPAD